MQLILKVFFPETHFKGSQAIKIYAQTISIFLLPLYPAQLVDMWQLDVSQKVLMRIYSPKFQNEKDEA